METGCRVPPANAAPGTAVGEAPLDAGLDDAKPPGRREELAKNTVTSPEFDSKDIRIEGLEIPELLLVVTSRCPLRVPNLPGAGPMFPD